jgi:hypothetical protein
MSSVTAPDQHAPVRDEPKRRRPPLSRWQTVVLGVLLAAVVIGVVVRPILSRGTEFVGFDWYQHVWYLWHMEGSMSATGFPSLYAHNTSGVFDPHFAFYGGTLYTIAGALTLLVGSHVAAYAISWVLAAALIYGSWFWLARQAGLGPWASHAPGILLVTSGWYVSLIYTWGSWAQTVCFGALALLVAGAIALLRADRLRFGPAVGFSAGLILYTGSHNLTLAWGTTVVAITIVVLLAVVPGARALITKPGLGRLALIGIPSLMVNGWFLLPALVYQSHTTIATNIDTAHGLLTTSMNLVSHQYTLTLGRSHDFVWTHLSTQLPLLAAVWVIAGLAIFRPRWRSPWVWTIFVLTVAGVATAVLMTRLSWILHLPHPLDMVQGPYRIEAYPMMAAAAALIAGLVLAARSTRIRRRWAWLLVPVLAVSVVQANSQANEPLKDGTVRPPWSGQAPRMTPAQPLGAADYVDGDLPQVVNGTTTLVTFSPTVAEKTSRGEVVAKAQPGDWITTNLKAAPWLVKVDGATIVARDQLGNAVLQVDDDATPGAARIVVTTAHPWPVVLGRDLTFLGLAGLLAIGLALLRRRLLTGRLAAV